MNPLRRMLWAAALTAVLSASAWAADPGLYPGAKLDPDGPSMWFATPRCQWDFRQQHADNPGEVYSRPDPFFDSAATGVEDLSYRHGPQTASRNRSRSTPATSSRIILSHCCCPAVKCRWAEI